MRYLVSCDGYVGAYLVNALAKEGNEVIALFRAEPPFIEAEVKDKVKLLRSDFVDGEIEAEKVDVIIHAASMTPDRFVKQNVRDFISYNVTTTVNLCEFARRNRVKKFIYLSDTEVYGEKMRGVATEEAATNLISVYAMSKYFAETVIEHYKEYFSYLILRVPTILGPGVFKNWIGDLITQFRFSEDIYIYNSEGLYNDIADIYELVRFMHHISKNEVPMNEVLNFAAAEPLKIDQIVRAMSMKAGTISKIVKQESENFDHCIDTEKLTKKYGFTTKTVKQILEQYVKDNL